MALLYHDEDSLTEIRPDIYKYGVTDFESQMTEAEDIINRTLDARWYRNVALNRDFDWREEPFDSSRVVASTQLRRLASYKSLQLIYIYLMKETKDPDVFERQSSTFKKLFAEELNEVLTAGIDYDWTDVGTISPDETKIPRVRRLHRV